MNVDEVRSFVGIVNYYGRFLKNLSTVIYPLNNLLKKEVPCNWTSKCGNAFQKVKNNLQSNDFLVHYDTQLSLILATYASSYGVGAVLSHICPDGSERPIQYASQTLSLTQQKYTQLDKEAFAITFGVRGFAQYLLGRRFTLQVDNKPLVHIFLPSKGLPTFAAMRMQHYELFLRNFYFDIMFRKTGDHGNANAMSRLPISYSSSPIELEETDVVEINMIETLPIRVKELEEVTLRDKSVANLIHGLRTGRGVKPGDIFGVDQVDVVIV